MPFNVAFTEIIFKGNLKCINRGDGSVKNYEIMKSQKINNSTISVLIPNWNGMPVIDQCLSSIFKTCRNLRVEVLVFDNGSSDGSTGLISEKYPEVRLMRESSNVFFARATNELARVATGDFLLLLNNDIILTACSLEKLLKEVASERHIGVVVPKLLSPDGALLPSCRRFPTLKNLFMASSKLSRFFPEDSWKMVDFAHDYPCFVDQPMMSAFLVKRECWEDVGPLDERFPLYFNDVDWCYRAKKRGWKILFQPEAKVVHYDAWSGRKLGPKQVYLSVQGLYRYFRKHHVSLLSPRYPLLILLGGGMVINWLFRRVFRDVVQHRV